MHIVPPLQKFEETKEVIRSSKSKRNNGQKKKRTNGETMIYKILCRKLKVEQYESHKNNRMNVGSPQQLPGVTIPVINHE